MMPYAVAALAVALLAGCWLLVRELREWRAAWSVASLAPWRIEHVHRLHDESVTALRGLVRVATMGAETPQPSKRGRGSPDPEATATRRVQDDAIARLGLHLQTLYQEQGQPVTLEQCLMEAATAIYAAEVSG